jgi:zinc protease
MKRNLPLAVLALSAELLGASATGAQQRPAPPAPFKLPVLAVERYALPNGLTVVLSESHASQVVTVMIWYHVGSKNETIGHTGLAHLFEHVMALSGSAHVPGGQAWKIVTEAGGGSNGFTTEDYTAYFETLPGNELATALWIESDQMGWLLPAFDQSKLDAQREVVKNERRQRLDNVTYGSASEVIAAALYPRAHPYSWPVIGSMADLSAATLEEVKEFFRTYYSPNNATLVIAGDFKPGDAKALVARYFGEVPRGAPVRPVPQQLATLSAEKRLVLEDPRAKVPQLRIVWPAVGLRHPDATALTALGPMLTLDRTSRLTKLLVYDRQLATAVDAVAEAGEIAGTFTISVTPRSDASLAEIERLVDSVVTAVQTTTPLTSAELDRWKNSVLVNAVLRIELLYYRALALAEGQVFYGDPRHYAKDANERLSLTAAATTSAARKYLGAGRVVLSMVPAGKLDLIASPEKPYTNVTPRRGNGVPPSR